MSKKTINTRLGNCNIEMNYDTFNDSLQKSILNFTSKDNQGLSIFMQLNESFEITESLVKTPSIKIQLREFLDNHYFKGMSMALDLIAAQFLIDHLQIIINKMKIEN